VWRREGIASAQVKVPGEIEGDRGELDFDCDEKFCRCVWDRRGYKFADGPEGPPDVVTI
jgi:hypothetical protein